MRSAVPLLALLLAGCAAVASSFSVSVYSNSACTTETLSFSTVNGDCHSGNPSASVVCANETTASNWTLFLFNTTGCTSPSTLFDTISGVGGTCQSGGALGYVKVECGDPATCFSGQSLVELEDGRQVPIQDVDVGDRVLSADPSGRLFYDKVFRITHWDTESRGNFVRLTTEGGQQLELTAGHYVHVSSLGLDSMVLAEDVKVGDEVFTVSQGALAADSVVKVERGVVSRGFFNLHTLSGRLVVNGIVATHFTAATTWNYRSMAPLWYRVVDLFSPLFGAQNAKGETLRMFM